MARLLPVLLPLLLSAALPGALRAQPSIGAPSVDQTFDRIERLQQQSAARQRAINLARNTIVKLNGGLTRYMPAACMFSTGSGVGNCLVASTAEGFRFRFSGGAPGWQQQGQAPTLSSEVLISPDGRQVLEVVDNAAPC